MNDKKLSEGFTYLFIGIIFLLITVHIIFAFFILLAKIALYIIGGLCALGGIVTILESFTKNKQDEN